MKKIRGILILAAILAVLAQATVARAACYYDAARNIVWCTDAMGK